MNTIQHQYIHVGRIFWQSSDPACTGRLLEISKPLIPEDPFYFRFTRKAEMLENWEIGQELGGN